MTLPYLDIDKQIKQAQADRKEEYDRDIFSNTNKADYNTTLVDEEEEEPVYKKPSLLNSYTAPKSAYLHIAEEQDNAIPNQISSKKISDREGEYRQQRMNRKLSPTRVDAFSKDKPQDDTGRSYADVMREAELDKETERVKKIISDQKLVPLVYLTFITNSF